MSVEDFINSLSGDAPGSGTPEPVGEFLGSFFSRPEPDEPWYVDALDIIGRPGRAVSEAFGEALNDGNPLSGALRGLQGDYKFPTFGEQVIPESKGSDYDPQEEFFKWSGRLALDIVTDPLTFIPVGGAKHLGKLGFKAAGAVGKSAMKVKPIAAAMDKALPISQALARATLPSTAVLRKFGGSWGRQAAQGIDRMYVNSRMRTAEVESQFHNVLRELGLHTRKAEAQRIAAALHVDSGNLRKGIQHADPKVQKLAEFIKTKFDEIGTHLEQYSDNAGNKFLIEHPGLVRAQTNIQTYARKRGWLAGKHKGFRNEVWDRWLNKKGMNPKWTDQQKNLYRKVARELDDYGMARDGGKDVWTKGFSTRPFKRLDDYIPQMLNEDQLAQFATKTGFTKAAQTLARLNGIDEFEAQKILRQFGSPRKMGNIEYARQLRMKEEWLERDPLKFLPRYFEKSWNRIAFADEFQLTGKKLKKLLRTSVHAAGLDARWAEQLQNVAMGRYPRDLALDQLARKVMGFQIMTKMGPLSALANFSQNINTFIREGGHNFVKGVLRAQTEPGKRAGIVAYQRGIHDALMRLTGGESSWASRYLEMSGFSPIERMNRLLAANAGIVNVESAARTAGKLTDDLAKKGLTNDDIKRLGAANWDMRADDVRDIADKVGFLASEATQHATHWKDIPLYWQHPAARMALQYKSFVYQQTRFLIREVLSPAKKWFKSGGKQGSLAPMMRAGVAFGIGAETMSFTRDKTRELMGKGLSLIPGVDMEQEPREFDEEHPFWQLFEKSMYVGALGAAGDLVERATRRDLKGWLLGPTVGDISDLIEGTFGYSRFRNEGDPLPLHRIGKEILRRTPFAGTLLPRGSSTTEQLEGALETPSDAIGDFLDALSTRRQ